MKKNVVTYVKSIVIAACVCAGLAFGALSTVCLSQETPVVAAHPNFTDSTY